MPAVMVSPARDQIVINDTRFIDIDSATGLQIEATFRHRRHPSATHAVGVSRDLHPMAHRGNRLSFGEKILRHPHQILVIADVFRRAAAREKEAQIFALIDL